MLEELTKREDVQKLLKKICNYSRYYDKKSSDTIDYQLFVDVEQVLFLFYDALFKYKIIIDDIYYFDEYIEQLDMLFKKINNIHDISNGIHKLIGKICFYKLGLKNFDSEEEKSEVLRYVYDKYIENGYYIHGYSSYYEKDIKKEGFIPEVYHNLYNKFILVKDVLCKHGETDIIEKDFFSREVSFTDNMMMGCYYSANSPLYFYKLICKNGMLKNEDIGAYFKGDYDKCLKYINKLCSKLSLDDKEKDVLLDAFDSEWKLIDKSNSHISLLLVPRKLISTKKKIDISKFILDNKDNSLVENLNKLIGGRTNNICYSEMIDKDDIIFVNLDGYNQLVEKDDNKKDEVIDEFDISPNELDDFAFSNVYGKVSVLLLVGAIFITVGVILTIIMLSKGM